LQANKLPSPAYCLPSRDRDILNEIELARLYRVRGLVQGVGFRYFTQRTALRLGVKGLVRNLANGDVEVQAEASTTALEQFHAELKRGPRSAEVSEVLEQEIEPAHHSSFHIRD